MPLTDDMPIPGFGRRLRLMRRAAGIKQSALAHELGINQASLSRWESGHQLPERPMQDHAFSLVANARKDDFALRRLIENARAPVHLVEETAHICLAYSSARAREWGTSSRGLIGTALWPFATEEIQRAEADLSQSDWWEVQIPKPHHVETSSKSYAEFEIIGGGMLWERLYLSDGTPVRLTTRA